MVENVELGVDVKNTWEFSNGDLILVDNEENLKQVASNRLNTYYGSLNLFYEEYGTFLTQMLGMRRDDVTLEFIRLEVSTRLSQDPRFQDYTVECKYGQKGTVLIDINVYFDDETDYTLNFVISEDNTVTTIIDEDLGEVE